MAHKTELRKLHENTTLNKKSKKQDKEIIVSRTMVIEELQKRYPDITFETKTLIYLKDIVNSIKEKTGCDDFYCEGEKSSMKPDGGFLYAIKDDKKYLILISEKKNQGTNDARALEGKVKQAMGNAVERLAKNMRGVEMLMITEDVFPFVTFLDGYDFQEGSTIRDRVTTMGMFCELNKIYVKKLDLGHTKISRGSFFVREELWNVDEMYQIMLSVAEESLKNYNLI